MGPRLELFRSLGQALIELVKAELEALGEEFAGAGKKLAVALALLGAAAAFAFWTVAALLYTVVEVIALWLPRWGAAAIVTGVGLLAVGLLALVGIVRLRRLESPARTVGRRLADHREWWNEQLLAGADEGPALAGRPPEELS